jgi:transcriptional regulator with XRE-family HTH domain
VTQQPIAERRALARRLRELRTEHFGRAIGQSQLSAALGCSVPSISSWESAKGVALPSEDRLRSYAAFFSTRRSISGPEPRLLHADELDAAERDEREGLENELLKLRAAEAGTAAHSGGQASVDAMSAPAFDPWRFPPGEPIRIVCAEPPKEMLDAIPYTDPNDPDYIALYRYSDLDSLLELHGYLNRVNPDSSIEARVAPQMSAADYMQHVVLLGGVDWNVATRNMLEQIHLNALTRGMPVRQVSRDTDEVQAGFVVGDRSFTANLVPQGDSMRLIEDIAHFYRGPNPVNPRRTVTICNGMYGRGVLGTVLALTRVGYRQRNAEFIRSRFGDKRAYSILTRVQILGGEVATPDWTVDENVLHAWPAPAA